jgi:hypothetical protein
MRETLWLERPVLHSDGVHATIRHCNRAPNFVSRQTLLPDHQHILLLSSTCYALTHHRAEPRPIGCLPSPSHCTFQDGLLGGAVPIPSTPRGLRSCILAVALVNIHPIILLSMTTSGQRRVFRNPHCVPRKSPAPLPAGGVRCLFETSNV